MFTGIIEEIGKIASITSQGKGIRSEVTANSVHLDAKIGDSMSVNGCCLTIVKLNEHSLFFDVVEETMLKTNFVNLKIGSEVNLERAVKVNDRLGGHLVQGHIDGIGQILSINCSDDGSSKFIVSAPHFILRYIISKGSITVDGVSLTVTELTEDTFSFAMIPHTSRFTTLGSKIIYDTVNIEVDMMAKYIERLMIPSVQKSLMQQHG